MTWLLTGAGIVALVALVALACLMIALSFRNAPMREDYD